MEPFLSKHAHAVTGTLSGFDRLVVRGTSRLLGNCRGMMRYLWTVQVLLKDFSVYAEAITRQPREASEALARQTGRPIRYLASSAASKQQIAREIARTDNITQGLICILEAVEPCLSYQVIGHRESQRLLLRPRQRKCLHLYHYQIHPVFGFIHARIQTWFPFTIQICLNGREWLARSMETAGLGFLRCDNCFTWLEDPAQTQQLMDQRVRTAWTAFRQRELSRRNADWPDLLDGIARSLNPARTAMFEASPIQYYWSTYQSEWATDIMFRDGRTLAGLYPKLVHHAMTTFASPDVPRFLGHTAPPTGTIPSRLQAEVTSDLKRRPEGARIKHRVGSNSVKMYDKHGSVLRIETTINDVDGFKTFRAPEGKPDAPKSQQRMRKGIADLHLGVSARSRAVNETRDRRSETSQACNNRFLQAMASVQDTTPLGELTARLGQPVKRRGRQSRAINPHAQTDAKLSAGAVRRR